MASNTIGNMAIQLGLNLTNFTSDWKRAARENAKHSKKMQKDLENAMKRVAQATTGAAVALALMIRKTAAVGDQFSKMSQKLGVSVDFLSKYDFIAGQAGTNIETVGTAIKKMEKSINDANNGLTTSIRAFDSLGISLETLNKLSPEEQFALLSDAMGKVETQSIKTGAAMDIFGRAGTDLIPMFGMAVAETDKLTDAQKRFGSVINDIQADSAVKFTDAMDALNENAKGFTQTLSFALMPALTEIIEQFNDDTIRDASDDWSVMQFAITSVYSSVLLVDAAFEVMGGTIALVAIKGKQSFELLAKTTEGFWARLKRGNQIIIDTFSGDFTASDAMGRQVEEIESQYQALIDSLTSKNEGTGIGGDLVDGFDNLSDKILAVSGAFKKQLAQQKKNEKQDKKTKKSLSDIAKEADKIKKEFDKLGKSFDGVTKSLQTPIEALTSTYKEQVAIVKEWQSANILNFDIWQQSEQALAKLDKKFKTNTKSIESQLTPYEQLIKTLQDELDLLTLTGSALEEATAKQYLNAAGVDVSALSYDELIKKYRTAIDLQNQLSGSSDASFEQKIGGISTLISSLDNMHNAFEDMGRDFGKGMQALSSGLTGMLDGLSEVLNKDLLGGKLGKALGVVGLVGDVASFIDSISGGKLFGTDYAQESSTTSFNLSQTGGGGSSSQTNVRERSLFRGRQWQTIVSDLSEGAEKAIGELFEQVVNIFDIASSSVGSDLEQIVVGAFKQTFDSEGNLASEVSTILGRTYNEDFGAFSQRLIAENIIAVLDSVLPQVEREVTQWWSTYEPELGMELGGSTTSTQSVDEVSHLANQFRDQGAEALLDFANFALQAVNDIQDAAGLFGNVTDSLAIVQDLAKGNETLVESYARITGSTKLFESSLDIIGQSLDLTRDEFIRFSVDIAEAAGGLDVAASLWQSYFETFYSTQELLDNAIASAKENRTAELGDIGLSDDILPADFRKMFEDILPTLSAEALVQWLEAADAIGVVIDLESGMVANALQLADMIADVNSDLENLDLSPFARNLKDIKNAFNEQIATAIELGATEKELAMIQAYATRQIADAIKALEKDVKKGVANLYGSNLDKIEAQITALEEQGNAQSSNNDAINQAMQSTYDASMARYEAEYKAIQKIHDFADSLLLDSGLTTLNLGEQLGVAQSEYDETLTAAQGGDVDAINALEGISKTLLGLGRENFASDENYTSLFDTVRSDLSGLGISSEAPTAPELLSTLTVADPRLLELQEQQRVLLENIANGERFEEVMALAEQIRELTSVSKESFSDLAERLGIPIEQFVTDLGVNLDTLTVDTAIALSDVAQLLGIELTELADTVGVSLGDLADANSFLNDALENTIAGLPEGIQDNLTGLLENVENAANGDDRDAALLQLENYADSLPNDQRDALAPYFDKIDPTTDAQRQINSMNTVNDSNIQIKNSVDKVASVIVAEENQTQAEIVSLKTEISDLATEIRNLASQVAS